MELPIRANFVINAKMMIMNYIIVFHMNYNNKSDDCRFEAD